MLSPKPNFLVTLHWFYYGPLVFFEFLYSAITTIIILMGPLTRNNAYVVDCYN